MLNNVRQIMHSNDNAVMISSMANAEVNKAQEPCDSPIPPGMLSRNPLTFSTTPSSPNLHLSFVLYHIHLQAAERANTAV
jgi:hypothetical protein